jgi:hypothetical protein
MAQSYVPPGSYVQQAISNASPTATGVGTNLCIIGEGVKYKYAYNEAHYRGQISGEQLTVSASSPHTASLMDQSDQQIANTTLYMNGVALPVGSFVFLNSTSIQIADLYYDSSATYTIDYIAINTVQDFLDNPGLLSIVSVGTYPGSQNFVQGRDYIASGGNVYWLTPVQASFTGINAGPFNLSSVRNINLQINGLSPIQITLPSGGAVTTAAVVAAINTALSNSPIYGSAYNAVAVANGNYVQLVAPVAGEYYGTASSITFLAASASDATSVVFGITPTKQYFGTGLRPVAGAQFFVTYTYSRPSSDYNVVKVFYTDTDSYNDIGRVNYDNKLSQALYLAWMQGISNVYVIQVQDSAGNGVYTDQDYVNAIQALKDQRSITEIVPLRSTATIRAAVKSLMQQECSLSQSNFKRYWVGAPINTLPGDLNTPDSYVYIAQNEFYVTPTDPTRGRYILAAPDTWQLTITNIDGSQSVLTVDSCFASVADAALMVSFAKASDSLLRKEITGLTLVDPYSASLQKYLTPSGVNVHTFVSPGAAMLFDPVTTDVSGDVEFREISSSVQKDMLAFSIINAVNLNIVGIVPDNISDFIGTIKSVVGGVILSEIQLGNIGKYRDKDGNPVDIDYTKDIVAYQDANDQTTYYYKYYFFLKYVAKRIFGQFTVLSNASIS